MTRKLAAYTVVLGTALTGMGASIVARYRAAVTVAVAPAVGGTPALARGGRLETVALLVSSPLVPAPVPPPALHLRTGTGRPSPGLALAFASPFPEPPRGAVGEACELGRVAPAALDSRSRERRLTLTLQPTSGAVPGDVVACELVSPSVVAAEPAPR